MMRRLEWLGCTISGVDEFWQILYGKRPGRLVLSGKGCIQRRLCSALSATMIVAILQSHYVMNVS